MPNVVGVVFHKGGKVYDFDAGTLDLYRGDQVVVETIRGTELGTVAVPPHEVEEAELAAPLKPVLRRATAQDLETAAAHAALRTEALATCRKLIAKHGLDMKLVDAEVMFGGGKIIISFFAEERVDFRALVVDLAKALKMRIELRQIGVRDEARMFGGLGPCGRHLCCTLFQVDQEPVSIRMAKEQNLPLNPMKISGLCGRLMCCLKYEQEQYVAFRKDAPRRGTPVTCPHGEGVVAGYQVPKDAIVVRLADGTLVEAKCSAVRVVGDERCCGGEELAAEVETAAAGAEVPDTIGLLVSDNNDELGLAEVTPEAPVVSPSDVARDVSEAAEAGTGQPEAAGEDAWPEAPEVAIAAGGHLGAPGAGETQICATETAELGEVPGLESAGPGRSGRRDRGSGRAGRRSRKDRSQRPQGRGADEEEGRTSECGLGAASRMVGTGSAGTSPVGDAEAEQDEQRGMAAAAEGGEKRRPRRRRRRPRSRNSAGTERGGSEAGTGSEA